MLRRRVRHVVVDPRISSAAGARPPVAGSDALSVTVKGHAAENTQPVTQGTAPRKKSRRQYKFELELQGSRPIRSRFP